MNDKFYKNKIDCIEKKLCAIVNNTSSLPKSNLQKLEIQANDLVQDFTYADPNDPALRRVTSIVYSSVSLGITVTETFTYTLSGAGDYYVTKIELS